jgi:hypothetical protein
MVGQEYAQADATDAASRPIGKQWGRIALRKAIAGLDLATCDRGPQGHIDVCCGDHHVPVDVAVEPGQFGPKVTVRFLTAYWLPAAAPLTAPVG